MRFKSMCALRKLMSNSPLLWTLLVLSGPCNYKLSRAVCWMAACQEIHAMGLVKELRYRGAHLTTGFWLQLDAIAIPNNMLVVAYNDSPNKRSPLRLATSTDGGLTWTKGALIEDDPEGSFHYPALLYDAKKVSTISEALV